MGARLAAMAPSPRLRHRTGGHATRCDSSMVQSVAMAADALVKTDQTESVASTR